jgi:hypothetical protein
MVKNRELKVELINELSFLIGLQEKVWKYHPNNPNAVSVVDEYSQLQIEIGVVEKALEDVD